MSERRTSVRWVSLHVWPHRCEWRPYVDRNAGIEVGWLWFALDIGLQ